MNDTVTSVESKPSRVHIRCLDQICDTFESAWLGGEKPAVEAYLGDTPEPERTELVGELIRVDVHYRRRAGETPMPADYSRRFPTLPEALLTNAVGVSIPNLGAVLNGYRLKEELGQGGMGRVYRAAHPRLDQDVALKVLQPGLESGPIVARFEAERQTLARMDHPHIARVIDGGVTDDGRPFFAMELVRGLPITLYCSEHRLRVRERLQLFTTVCQAVQHAHQKGIIHRDLKPSNILVAEYDGKPIPKVIDFGIARAIERRSTHQTEAGMLVGTPDYMSPEQADLASQDIDTRSDIYALGVVLYELLTGKTPFAQRAAEVPILEHLRMIREVDPPPPSTRLHTSLKNEVRGELDWITLKCLEKDRTRRYATSVALAEDLRRYLQNEPVLAKPASAAYLARKFLRRHRVAVVAVVSILLALIGGIIGTTLGMVRANRATAEKQTALDDLEIEQERTQTALVAEKSAFHRAKSALDTLTDEVVERLLARQDNLSAADRAFLLKIMAEYDALAATRGDSQENRALRANGHQRVGSIKHRLGNHADAAVSYQHARDLYQQLCVDFPNEPTYLRMLGWMHMQLGHSRFESMQFDAADTELRAAHEVLERLNVAFPKKHRQALATSLDSRGNLANGTGKPADAIGFYRQAIALYQAIQDDSPNAQGQDDSLARSHNNLGQALQRLKKFDEAGLAYGRTIEIREKQIAFSGGEPLQVENLIRVYINRAILAEEQNDASAAESDYRLALRISMKLTGDYPAVSRFRKQLAIVNNRLGALLEGEKRYEEAETSYQHALALRKQLIADFPNEPEFALDAGATYCNLGNLRRNQNQPAESLEWYAQAIQVLTPVADRDGGKTNARRFLSNSHHARALSLQMLDRHADAIPDWNRVVELTDDSQRDANRLRRAACAAHVSPEKAAAEIDEVMQNKHLPGSVVYTAAAVYAIASGRTEQTLERETYAVRALALLQVAQAKGLFNDPARVEALKSDAHFTQLRTRTDFVELLAKIAVPEAE